MVKLSQQEFEKKYGKSSYNALSNIQPSNELNSYSLSETFGDIKQTGSNLINTVKETFAKSQEAKTASRRGEQGMVRGFAQQAGIGLGGISQVGGDLFTGAVKTALPQAGEDVLKAGVSSTVKPLTESNFVKSIYEKYNSLDETKKRDIDATLGLGSFLTDLVGFGLAKKPVVSALKAGSEAVTTGIKAAEEITTRIPRATEKLITMTKEGITPVISKEKAIGEVLQGTTQDIKKGTAGLSLVDTKGIKTYQKLNEAIDKKIPELAKVVDNEFAQDTTKKLLNDLTITKPTKAGGTVSVNYVDNALNQLAELYTKTGDVVKQADIEDLINIAKTDGLNKLEINDIARNYGQEFGDKAFNKMGDPLTSINAQMFENTRKGVKEVARSGLTSNVAKKADEAMSKLYDTRALVKKNVEAVNKLMNRIEERGLVEKIGYNVSKYADILTGGSLRGFIGGILPRGAGYKTLNALDLEALLERNLKIINEATKAKTPSQFKEITSQLLDRNSSVKNTLTNEAKNINQVTKTGANINNANKTNSIIQDTIPLQKKSGQAGMIKISDTDRDIITKDLLSIDTLPVKVDGKLEFGNSDDYFRIGQLQDKVDKKILTNAEYIEARDLVNKVLNRKPNTKKGAAAMNPLTVGAGVTALGAGTVSLKNKK